MANFENAFQLMITHEGGYVNDPDDPGGETYKGVARKSWPKWLGWHIIDLLKRQAGFPGNLDSNADLQSEVQAFYEIEFWNRISGSLIQEQSIANSIFDFAVNAGTTTSVTLAQMVAGSPADGISGSKTVGTINQIDPDYFLAAFTVEKIKRYVEICQKRPESKKYFFGWVTRAIK